MKELFNVEEVANILNVHTRTVRRYIKEGKMEAKKVGGQWRVTKENLESFMDTPLVLEQIQSESDRKLKEFFDGTASGNQKISTCSVVDIKAQAQEELKPVCMKIMEQINSVDDGEIRFEYYFKKDQGIGRFTFWGSAKIIGKILTEIDLD